MLKDAPSEGRDFRSFLADRHEGRAAQLRAEYTNAVPWPHVVIDDFLPEDIAQEAAASFPAVGRVRVRLARLFGARSYGGAFESSEPSDIPVMAAITAALDDPRFTALIESITGIAGLKLDCSYAGSGFHIGVDGSYLRLHADHNTHPNDPTRFRRANVLLYLSKQWHPEWNGDLELWDREARTCVAKIEPRFNRCVIMGVDDSAFHGYGRLRMPPGNSRNLLGAYYYADAPAKGQAREPHPTVLPSIAGKSVLWDVAQRLQRRVLARVEKALLLRSHR